MANYGIREFNENLGRWSDAAGDGLKECVEIMGEKIITDLVRIAPVDTGRFRGNMQVTANKPPLYALNRYDKDGGKTIAEGVRAVHGLMRGGGAVRSLYFSNMLIYANALEYGHSKQAPTGVFGVVAVKLKSYMVQAIKESRAKHAL